MAPGGSNAGHGLRQRFGEIDIYLFDQLLRGRITPAMRVLDAGCGDGRNLVYLAAEGARVHGVDRDRAVVTAARDRVSGASGGALRGSFQVAGLEALPFVDGGFDAVICNAVLHFSEDEAGFHAILDELWRVLAPGGVLFTRLASDIGIEERVGNRRGRRGELPDGTERFLVDERLLSEAGERLGATLLDPIKTTNVQGLRCMTTWVLGKPA